MKTVAVITCADTKGEEFSYIIYCLRTLGVRTLSIDISTRLGSTFSADVQPTDILKTIGEDLHTLKKCGSKADCIDMMTRALCIRLKELYEEKRFDAVLGFGGLQNTVMISAAMQKLPIEVPKILVSTVVSGSRTCQSIIGTSNIIMVPTLVDIAGINSITKMILEEAALLAVGVSRYEKPSITPQFIVASTMGVVNDGVMGAVNYIKQKGIDIVPVHTTGTGGQIMEQFIREGRTFAALDLCLHEIVNQDVFGFGFSIGAKSRLIAASEKGIPMVVAPGGLDFIDVSIDEFNKGVIGEPGSRKYVMHNNALVHAKINKQEAEKAASIVVERLNRAKGPVCVILPHGGLRTETMEGQKLYDPEVDNTIFDYFHDSLSSNVQILDINSNINSTAFSKLAAEKIIEVLKRS